LEKENFELKLILTVDNRGRVYIPNSIRKFVGLEVNSKVIAIANRRQKTIILKELAEKEG